MTISACLGRRVLLDEEVEINREVWSRILEKSDVVDGRKFINMLYHDLQELALLHNPGFVIRRREVKDMPLEQLNVLAQWLCDPPERAIGLGCKGCPRCKED